MLLNAVTFSSEFYLWFNFYFTFGYFWCCRHGFVSSFQSSSSLLAAIKLAKYLMRLNLFVLLCCLLCILWVSATLSLNTFQMNESSKFRRATVLSPLSFCFSLALNLHIIHYYRCFVQSPIESVHRAYTPNCGRLHPQHNQHTNVCNNNFYFRACTTVELLVALYMWTFDSIWFVGIINSVTSPNGAHEHANLWCC